MHVKSLLHFQELHFAEDLIKADMIDENDIFYYAVFRREQGIE